MARKKANYPLIEGLEITTLAAEGKAMGRWQDVVVFVPMTVPGDVVDVQIRTRRRRYMEGYVVRHEDGSMELLVIRHSKEDPRRIPLFDGNAEPNPHIRPIGKE